MGVLMSVQRTQIYKEFNEEDRKKYFNLSKSKVIHHIDTLYYSIYLKNDEVGNAPAGVIEFIEILEELKRKAQEENEDIYFNMENDILLKLRRFSIYEYCLGKEGFYDIFIAKSIPNDNTPRIVVQLRSIGLWTQGEQALIEESYDFIKSVLNSVDIEIYECKENRIDYAYHTNAIQSPYKFFNDDVLSNNLSTSFGIYSKVGRKNNKQLTVEYLSLGNRKSNNLFFRSYNKVREVIEENYKEFFLEYWFNLGLISLYDYEVYSYAYKEKRYDSIEWGKLEFYIKYGKNSNLKGILISKLRDRKNIKIDEVRQLLKGVMPEPTLIMNIEFQTMRKFYSSSDEFIDYLTFRSDITEDPLVRLFQIIDNRKIFLDYLTISTVAFKKDNGEYMDFWKRVQTCKTEKIKDLKLKRKYKRNINKEMLLRKIKSSLATLSLYEGNYDTDINIDFSLLTNILNDNTFNGEKYIDDEYVRIKDKKKKALNSILKKNDNSRPSSRFDK